MMTHRFHIPAAAFALLAALAVPAATQVRANDDNHPPVPDNSGAVYTASNGVEGNLVLVYRRAPNGTLSLLEVAPTGGRGSGGAVDPLQSQHSLLLSPDHRFLFAVNSGSGEITSFSVGTYGQLRFVGTTPSGGGFPVSLALHGSLLYALNSGGAGSVSGFQVRANGKLTSIPGSTHLLSAPSAGGASIDFSPDGTTLAATERLTNRVDTFPISADGTAGTPVLTASPGRTPFSLAFTPQGTLVVAESTGGPAGSSALTSYTVQPDLTLKVVTASLPTTFNGACWNISSADGRYIFSSNSASSTITTTGVSAGGVLTPLGSAGTGAGTVPLDLTLTAGDRYLYALTAGAGTISGFRVDTNGSLTALAATRSLPAASGQNGLAAF